MGKEKNEVISIIKEFKTKANKKIRLDKLIFFGSRATGKARLGSDIDLLLISPLFSKKRYYQRAPPFYLLWKYPYDVDILCLTPAELEKKRKEIGIIQQAVREGIVI